MNESGILRKLGAGSTHRFGPLLHADDVYILIESCEKFPHLVDQEIEARKKRPKVKSKRHRKRDQDKNCQEKQKADKESLKLFNIDSSVPLSKTSLKERSNGINEENDILMKRIQQENISRSSPHSKESFRDQRKKRRNKQNGKTTRSASARKDVSTSDNDRSNQLSKPIDPAAGNTPPVEVDSVSLKSNEKLESDELNYLEYHNDFTNDFDEMSEKSPDTIPEDIQNTSLTVLLDDEKITNKSKVGEENLKTASQFNGANQDEPPEKIDKIKPLEEIFTAKKKTTTKRSKAPTPSPRRNCKNTRRCKTQSTGGAIEIMDETTAPNHCDIRPSVLTDTPHTETVEDPKPNDTSANNCITINEITTDTQPTIKKSPKKRSRPPTKVSEPKVSRLLTRQSRDNPTSVNVETVNDEILFSTHVDNLAAFSDCPGNIDVEVKEEFIESSSSTVNKRDRSATSRPRRVRNAILMPPSMILSKKGKINFSEDLQKQAGLIKSDREKHREKRELDQLTKEAERILISDEKRVEEKLVTAAILAKKTELDKKKAEKDATKAQKLAQRTKMLSDKLMKKMEREKKRETAKPAILPKKDLKHSRILKRDAQPVTKPSTPMVVKPLKLSKKQKDCKVVPVSRKPVKVCPPKVQLMAPPEAPVPTPVLGCVTFRSGDKIIRRSPRKLPEAAVNAANPTTGVIPYAFAALLGNTHGAIPNGLQERHFVKMRPAMKRATPAWFDNLDVTTGEVSGRDSGLDSAEELAIRNLFTEKKREANRLKKGSSKSEPQKSESNEEILPEPANTDDLPDDEAKKIGESSSSGDSGRETPTAQESKPFTLKERTS